MDAMISAILSRPLWKLLQAEDIEPAAVFERFGLDPELIHDTRAQFRFDKVVDAWKETAIITGRDSIGLETAQYYNPLDLHALGVAFLSSECLRDALQRMARYVRVFNTYLVYTVEETTSLVTLHSTLPESDLGPGGARVVLDSRHAFVVDLMRRSLGAQVNPVEVAFTYPRPANVKPYEDYFRCKLLFGAQQPRVVFQRGDALRPFDNANRDLALGNDQILDSFVRELREHDLVSKVRKAIIEELPSGTPTESSVAGKIFVSGRTLQRRLAAEDTSFRELLVDVRRELAERYIADETMPLAEISYMLGFADTSSFSRAFKSWTGSPPNAFRQQMLAVQ